MNHSYMPSDYMQRSYAAFLALDKLQEILEFFNPADPDNQFLLEAGERLEGILRLIEEQS
jgi:hypothetical protein